MLNVFYFRAKEKAIIIKYWTFLVEYGAFNFVRVFVLSLFWAGKKGTKKPAAQVCVS